MHFKQRKNRDKLKNEFLMGSTSRCCRKFFIALTVFKALFSFLSLLSSFPRYLKQFSLPTFHLASANLNCYAKKRARCLKITSSTSAQAESFTMMHNFWCFQKGFQPSLDTYVVLQSWEKCRKPHFHICRYLLRLYIHLKATSKFS